MNKTIKTSKTTKKINALGLLFALLSAVTFFAACSPLNKEDYPGALTVSSSPLIGYREYVSKAETSLTITMTESMYFATQPEDDDLKKKHIAILSASCFPILKEDGVIEAGGVYEQSVEKIIPRDRKLVTFTLSGSQILRLAERTVESMLLGKENQDKYDDRYYHFSGVGFVYDTKNAIGEKIIETLMVGESKLSATDVYTVVTNDATMNDPKLKGTLGMAQDAAFSNVQEAGNEFDVFVKRIQETGISALSARFVDKADRDAPMVTMIVLIVLAVLVLVGIVVAYFVLKKKQKQARAKRGGQPRIDV